MAENENLVTAVKLLAVFLVALAVINAFNHLFGRLTAGEFAWDLPGTLSVLVLGALVVALVLQLFKTGS